MSKKPDESLEPFPALYHELVCSQIWYQESERLKSVLAALEL